MKSFCGFPVGQFVLGLILVLAVLLAFAVARDPANGCRATRAPRRA
jgi:hypothetical protein